MWYESVNSIPRTPGIVCTFHRVWCWPSLCICNFGYITRRPSLPIMCPRKGTAGYYACHKYNGSSMDYGITSENICFIYIIILFMSIEIWATCLTIVRYHLFVFRLHDLLQFFFRLHDLLLFLFRLHDIHQFRLPSS